MPNEQNEIRKEAKASVDNSEQLAALELERKMELLRRVRTLRERATLDRGKIEGAQPGKDYVWVCIDPRRQAEFQGLDYQVCTDPRVTSKYKQEDGTHRRGDVILYEVSTELREAYALDAAYRSIEQLEESFKATTFRSFATGSGIPVTNAGSPR